MVKIKQEVNSQEPIENSNHDIQRLVQIKKEAIEQLSQSTEEPFLLNDESVKEFAKNLRKTAKRQATLLGKDSETGSTMFKMLELIKFLMEKAYPTLQSLETEESSPDQPAAEIPTNSTNELVEASSVNITQLNSRRRGIAVQKLPKYKKRRLEEQEEAMANKLSIPDLTGNLEETPTSELSGNIAPLSSIIVQIPQVEFNVPILPDLNYEDMKSVDKIEKSHNRHESNAISQNGRRERKSKWDESPKKRKDDRRRNDRNDRNDGRNRRDDRQDTWRERNKRAEKNFREDSWRDRNKRPEKSSRDNYSREKLVSSRKQNSDKRKQESSSQHNNNSERVDSSHKKGTQIIDKSNNFTSSRPPMERQFFPNVWPNQKAPPPKNVVSPSKSVVVPSKSVVLSPKKLVVPKRPKIVPTAKKPSTIYPGLIPMAASPASAKLERQSSPIESQEETQRNWTENEVSFFRNIISRLNSTKLHTERQKIIDELRNTNKLRSFLQFKARYQEQ